jgi:hypothetical protein
MGVRLNYLKKYGFRQGALAGSSNPDKLTEPNARNEYDLSI